MPEGISISLSCLHLEYKKALNEHTRVAVEAMEDTIQEVCSSTNQVLDTKLNEIYCVLEDIGKPPLEWVGISRN